MRKNRVFNFLQNILRKMRKMLLGSYDSDNRFKRHTVWDGMGISSLVPFERIVSRISLKPVISPDIVKRFEVVKRLILHSYFEYEFLDTALVLTHLILDRHYLDF